MSHAIVELQTGLIAALLADTQLLALLGGEHVFDAPPRQQLPPYVAISRHDVLPRDGDDAPGNDHRILMVCWHPDPSRSAVLGMADRVVATALSADLSSPALLVTHAQHDRTDTAIDLQSGHARAAIALRVLSEMA